MLAVFAEFERDILRDRVKAGIAQARQEGRPHGRPAAVRRAEPQSAASWCLNVVFAARERRFERSFIHVDRRGRYR